jgi:hypothetical protein
VNDGVSFETYDVTFGAIRGDAIRIWGRPGGKDDFISVGELRVYGSSTPATATPVRTATATPVRTSTPVPTATEPPIDRRPNRRARDGDGDADRAADRRSDGRRDAGSRSLRQRRA